MTKQTNNSPTLRFPEFCEDWKAIELGDVAKFKNGLNFSNENRGKGLKIIGVSDFKDFPSIQYDSLDEVSGFDNIDESYLLRENDILFVRSNGNRELIGRALLISNIAEKISYSGFTIRARIDQAAVLPGFVALSLKRNSIKSLLMMQGGGTNISNLNQGLLSRLPLSLPGIAEQQKITTFFLTVDEKIGQLTKKKELLLKYKKAVLQQIFEQKVRFKDDRGHDFSDWNEMRGNEVFRSHSNREHDGSQPILAASQGSGMVPREGIGIRIQSTAESISSYKVVEPGDFVISLRSFQGGLEYSRYEGICSPAYTILKPRIAIDDDFFRFYFKKEDFIERLSKTVVGIRDGKQISYEAFGGLKLKVPSVAEQAKIARFLIAVEEKIELVGQQLEKVKIFKKGLLQQMFV